MNVIARTQASRPLNGRESALRMEESAEQDEDFVSTLPSDLFDDEDLDIVLNAEAAPSRAQAVPRFDAIVAWSHAQASGRREPTIPTSTPTPTPTPSSFHMTEPGAWTDGPVERLRFTGTGSEYFRMWVIHLLLCVATLGLYAPWAQRRDLQWWARHTLLDGDPFDFHGAPHRMLAHRLMGLVLVVGVWLSLLQPFWTGAAMLGVMMLGAAALSMRIRRFRLQHLSWRGLRLGQRLRQAPHALAVLPPVITGRSRFRLGASVSVQRAGANTSTIQLLLSRAGLLLLTMGLYWPFLAVHLARLRVAAMNAHADDLRTVLDTPALTRAPATGPTGRTLGLA